ncbi:acetate--CoA ligase family protein [Microbacterium sp. CPCC 204701]|uniref:acetate--CoA ligase family protein n=1 Tax=Microbacterium sp. CPCC 204701 TaxID=2493084 RepID=UPI000FD8DE28|nr:acetate--CoA ligase family protein [Microbacterium sp. CPCC 204701]
MTLTPVETHPVSRLLNPQSVAIIGMSSKPGASGRNLLGHLDAHGFTGDVHLVGRGGGEFDGRTVLTQISELPEGVDLALIALPASAVADAVRELAARGVRTGIVYASGFSELGEAGRAAQAEISRIALESGMRLAGPNCIGYNNHVHGMRTVFLPGGSPIPTLAPGATGALAILAQSGGLMGLVTYGLEARRVPVSYAISTGNEASLTLADYLDFLADDDATGGIVMYIEDIRDPAGFLASVRKCRQNGKSVILTHAGRSERGQQATASHTGALAADYGVMKALATRAGACVVESIEELMDVAEILTRYPSPPRGGIGFATTSGAFCALALDAVAPLDVDVPALSPAIEERLNARLPSYMSAANPLDVGTLVAVDPDLYHDAARALLDDEAIGAVILGVAYSSVANNERMLRQVIRASAGNLKPLAVGLLGDIAPVSAELRELAAENNVILSSSPERLIRSMAAVFHYGRAVTSAARQHLSLLPVDALEFGVEATVEWAAKRVAAGIGIPVPQGGLATTVEEAIAIADRVGYPVAAKAQSAKLMHKTEAGGVVLGIAGEAELRRAYEQLDSGVGALIEGGLDGVLVEQMADKGVELMVGAKRHPTWGPVVVVGLGGVWVEALGDVRILPADLPIDDIVAELGRLRSSKLLGAFRGRDPLDVRAVAETAARVGELMLRRPDIQELDINPLLATPEGVTALDVLLTFTAYGKGAR